MKNGLWRQHPGPAAARLDIEVPDQEDPPEAEYIRWLSQLQADLAQSIGGVSMRANRAIPLGISPGATRQPLTSPGRILGWSVHETVGAAPCIIRLWDGREAGGSLLAIIGCGALSSANVWASGSGINVSDGVYTEIVSGTVEGVIYIGGVD